MTDTPIHDGTVQATADSPGTDVSPDEWAAFKQWEASKADYSAPDAVTTPEGTGTAAPVVVAPPVQPAPADLVAVTPDQPDEYRSVKGTRVWESDGQTHAEAADGSVISLDGSYRDAFAAVDTLLSL